MAAINPGSFGAPAGGGGSAIAQAMQSRGLDPSVLEQVTPGAPTSPERGLPQPIGANPPSAVPGQPQRQPLPQTGQPGGLPPAESEIIVKALSSRLKKLGDLTELGFNV